MPDLYRADTGQSLCSVTEDQLRQLIDALVAESAEDTEYFVDQDTVAFLTDQGADPSVIRILETALASTGETGLDIAWRP